MSVDKKREWHYSWERKSWVEKHNFWINFHGVARSGCFPFFFENFQNKFYFVEFFHECLFESNKQTPEVAIEADGISQVPQQNEDDVGIAVHMGDHENDDKDVNNEVEDLFYDDEWNVWFGSPDFHDVNELIELSLKDADIGAEHESHDEFK